MIARCLVRQTTAKNYTFDYLIPEDMQLEELCLVEVPFLNKKREAVVLEIRQSSRYAKKNIIRKLSYGAVFTSQQLLLAKKIAYEFLSDPSSALFSFLPTLNKSDLKKIGSLKRRSIHQKRKPLVVISDWDYRVSYYLQSINKSQQNLIILPKISLIKKFSKQITTLDPSQKVYIWHSAISSREKSLIWQKLLSGENLTIVATRHGLFLPFTNLVLTIIDQPDDFSYFEDQAPRYNAKAAAKLANSIYLGQLIFGDTLISPEIYAWTSSGKAVLANKEDEIKFINASGLSQLSSLDESILALKNSKKILITGFFKSSSDLVCMDCERIIKQDYISSSICPHCNSPKTRKKIIDINEIASQAKINLGQAYEKATVASFDELDKLPKNFDLAIIPYFDIFSSYPFMNFKLKLLRSLLELKQLGIKKIILSNEKIISELGTQLSENKLSEIILKDIKNRQQDKLPPFTRAVKFSGKLNLLDQLEVVIKKEQWITQDDTTAIAFISHQQSEDLKKLIYTEQLQLKLRFDPPEFSS